MPNSFSDCTASSMIGRSLSLPIATHTLSGPFLSALGVLSRGDLATVRAPRARRNAERGAGIVADQRPATADQAAGGGTGGRIGSSHPQRSSSLLQAKQ